MKDKNLSEEIKSDDGVSSTDMDENPKKAKEQGPADKKVTPTKADEIDTDGVTKVEEEVVVEDTIASLFEGEELSEDFKKKATMIFEAAVSDAVNEKVKTLTTEIKEAAEKEIAEEISTGLDTVVEKLDDYLDYVVEEWLEENKLSVESGIKVEMAESLMDGLKTLFTEHNVDVNDETVNVVEELESEIESLKTKMNANINENVKLNSELDKLKAEKIFSEITEGMTKSNTERLRVLSEKLSTNDLTEYENNLNVLKETFLDRKEKSKEELTETASREEDEILTEDSKPVKTQYANVKALTDFLNRK